MRIITTACLMIVVISTIAFAQEPNGAALYKKHCVTCHGEDGRGKPALATMFKIEPEKLDLTTSEVENDTDEELLKVINDGINKMPGYKDKLNQEEQKEILNYIRKLGGK